jgi:putative membrane protein
MTKKRSFAARAAASLVVAAVPLAVLGCQNDGRSDSTPNASRTPPNEKVTQPAVKLDDTTKTNILLRQIHAANQEEIELGKIADDRAQNAEVKKFANDMVKDHTAADQKLTDLAKRMNVDIDVSPTDPVQKALSSASDDCKRSLRGHTGAQFDVAYFAPQVDKHTFALKLVDEAQKTASDDVKKLLDEMRPTVETHLDHAKSVMRGLTFASAVGGGPTGHEPSAPGKAPGVLGKRDDGPREAAPKGGAKGSPATP